MNDFTFKLSGNRNSNGDDVTACVRFNDDCKNGHQTFAITGEVYEHGKRHTDRNMISCGCCHDDIAEAYPELAPFIRWHLSSTDGPTHYHENASYWARKARGYYRVFPHTEWEKPDGREWDHFRSTVVFGAVEGDDDSIMHEPIAVSPPEGVIWEQFEQSGDGRVAAGAILNGRVHKWCIAREAKLMETFRRDMKSVKALA